MTTLYDLLGALADDGADELRAAFRNAVKGAHPDLNPGDPDAALRFRQIVRANEILSDDEQRAAYDHLLTLAQQEQTSASRHRFAAIVQRLASGIMAVSGLAVVTAGGYLLFMHISVASVGPGSPVATERSAMALAAPDEQTAIAPADASAKPARASATSDSVATANPDAASDLAGSIARSYRARALAAYHEGNVNGAIADLDRALQVDPKFSAAYIDRATIFYRLHKSAAARAFGTPKTGHSKAATADAFPKPVGIPLPPVSPLRAARQDVAWKGGLANER